MNLKFNDKSFDNVQDVLAGFITTAEADQQTFHMLASPTLSFNVGMQLIQSITINLLTAFIQQKPEAVEDIYDAYNFMASSVLNNLIPDKEIRLDLDEEAILKAEEDIINKQYDNMSDLDKFRALEKMKEIEKRLKDSKNVEDNKEV